MPQEHTRPAAVSTIEVACSQCGGRFQAEQIHCFDAAWDEKYKELLLDGSFFQWTCPQCGKYSEFAYESQYLDEEKKLSVVLRPGLESGNEAETLQEMNRRMEGLSIPGIRRRAVGNFYAMQEQARIRDDDLDDRAVQMLKPLIIGQLQGMGLEVWNGFFLGISREDRITPQDHVIYISREEKAEKVYSEPVYWFDIYLTDGKTTRQGINQYAYEFFLEYLDRFGAGEDNGEYQLYDLTWAIQQQNRQQED